MVPKFRSVLLALLVAFVLCFAAGPSQARSIGVMINDPGSRCLEDGATNISNVCTEGPTIDLTGWAGVNVRPIGTAVRCSDFPNSSSLRPGKIIVNITQAAAPAVLEGTADINRDLSAYTTIINGVEIAGGHNAAETISNINTHTGEIGIMASLSAAGHLVLQSRDYGYAAKVVVVQGAQLVGTNSAAAIGTDAEAEVTYEDGSPVTDDVWQAGYGGLSIGDIAGDSICLTEDAVTHTGNKGPQIEVSFDDVSAVKWHNLTNDACGQCAGTTRWQANGIPLAFGENTVVVAATTSDGESGFFPMAIDRYGQGSREGVAILSPTDQWEYTTHSSTIDLAGVCGFRDAPAIIAAPAIPAVLRCSFPQAQLQENDQFSINLIQPAKRATRAGTIPFDAIQGGVIIINGVDVPIGKGLSGVFRALDQFYTQTGVYVQRPVGNQLVLESVFCGSISRIEISNAAGVLGFDSARVVGTDAIAEVTDVSGAPVTDGVWDSGTGAMLRDSYGNSITLDETAAASVGDLGVALVTQRSPSSIVTWENSAAHASGTCNGVANWSADGIPLVPGQNTVQVTANDGSGNATHSNLWVTYFKPCSSIAEVAGSSGLYASLKDIVVTAGTDEIDSWFYAADSKRAAGIAVQGVSARRGERLTVDGIVWPAGGGYRMLAFGASNRSTGSFQPFGIGNKALSTSGGDIRFENLLVRVWGKVTLAWDRWITIDDGSGAPITCELPASVKLDPTWKFISVTGIVSIPGSKPVILPRDVNDIVAF